MLLTESQVNKGHLWRPAVQCKTALSLKTTSVVTYLHVTEQQHDVITKLCERPVVSTENVLLNGVQVNWLLNQLIVVGEPAASTTNPEATFQTSL